MPTQRHEEKKEPWPFGSSFYVFSSPMGLPYVNWASQECCLFYLMSSLWSLDLPLFYFLRLFPSLSFSHCHFGFLYSYSNYLTVAKPLSRGSSRPRKLTSISYVSGSLPLPPPGKPPTPASTTKTNHPIFWGLLLS